MEAIRLDVRDFSGVSLAAEHCQAFLLGYTAGGGTQDGRSASLNQMSYTRRVLKSHDGGRY
jgi:hypothetical protein